MNGLPRACDQGLAACHTCGLVVKLPTSGHPHCPRCNAPVHSRKPYSIQTAWALLITALLMYLPANLLPVMTVTYLGAGQPDTIMSGVIYLLTHGSWPLALIVFVASVMVPVLKILSLAYLLLSIQRKSKMNMRQRTRLYRVTELIGRWSMVDVFVVALLVALVQIGAIATIEPGMGASAFAALVILTMLAAMSFDPRLIWDQEEPE